MRSRKGSVTQTKSYGDELLPRGDIFLLHRLFQTRRRGSVQTKTFRKGSEASSRAERWRGYVIIFSNEPSCCYVATSERRRIRLKADYNYIALREASIRRSQRSNSEAVLFRGTLPRRTASGVRGVVITRALLVYYCRGDTTSSVRNVAITRQHYIPFYYLGGYVHITYSIVCGNCEAYFNLILFYK